MKKVIFDTDIGDDIDDAFALALLVSFQSVEILGVTTVFRNTACRAQLAKKLLSIMGKHEVPVYAGEAAPLREGFHRFAKDGEVPPEKSKPCQWSEEYESEVKHGAVDFLVESARRHGKDLTLFAVGPLTNMAKAIKQAPAVMQQVGALYIMGGSYFEKKAEWNILCDPEAADIVYRSGMPVYAVGLDVTMQCSLEGGLLDAFRRSGKPHNRLLTLWLDRWRGFFGFEKSIMHDPLAVASAFAPVCQFESQNVKVDLSEERGAILTNLLMGDGSEIYVANAVDCEKFYEIIRTQLL